MRLMLAFALAYAPAIAAAQPVLEPAPEATDAATLPVEAAGQVPALRPEEPPAPSPPPPGVSPALDSPLEPSSVPRPSPSIPTPRRGEPGARGLMIGVGYGVHRSFGGGLSAQDFDAPRTFDSTYVEIHGGWAWASGAFVAADWTHSSGTNRIPTAGGELKLALTSDFLGALVGIQAGSRARFHLAALSGAATGHFVRSLAAGARVDEHRSAVGRLVLGAQVGLDVLLARWLSIGARARLALSLGEGQADLGGLSLGLDAAVVL